MIRNSRRAFCLWALSIVTMLGLSAPVLAQMLTSGQADTPGNSQLLGGALRSGMAQKRQANPPQPAAPTSELLVFVHPGTNIKRFASEHGVQVLYALRSDPNAYVVR